MQNLAPHLVSWRGRRALIAANGGLLLLLAAVTLGPTAAGQLERLATRGHGDYTMVAGPTQGADTSVVYVIDSQNQDFIAVRWNRSTSALDGIGYRDLVADAALSPGR